MQTIKTIKWTYAVLNETAFYDYFKKFTKWQSPNQDDLDWLEDNKTLLFIW